jgi:Putative metallopeptidase
MLLRLFACFATALIPAIAVAQTPAVPAASNAAQSNRIKIDYVPPTNPADKPLYDLLMKRGTLERVQTILSPFKLPRDLTLRVKNCGMVNAWYDSGVITVCYEYLDFIKNNAPQTTTRADVTPDDALIGQTYFVFLHEAGHAMFDFFEVPVFGGEEDAADQFATYLMLLLGKNEAFPLVMGATYTFQSFLRKPEITSSIAAFSDIHGPPAQRYFNLICIAYGAHPETFKEVVDNHYLPQERAEDCAFEYSALAWAFSHLIEPNIDRELGQKVLDRDWLPVPGQRPKRPPHAP